ncbi:MAG: 50S ribosomal protein L24 [Candidatus Caldarchaeales archaeon]|jgi:large subunit ribosomal protein L24|nr:50S ribosomal protein L24 [Candidatus Caldarchaeales archaeon]
MASSSKPSKQRSLLLNLPKHLSHKMLSAPLSRELRERYGRRSLSVRVGDTVKIVRGGYRGVQGKVKRVESREGKVYIEGLTRKRVDGRVVDVPVHASNLVIISLNLDDEYRKRKLESSKLVEARGPAS